MPKQPAISLGAGQCVAGPDVRLVNAVEHQIGKRNRIDGIVLLTAARGVAVARFTLFRRRDLLVVRASHVPICLRKEKSLVA